MKLKNLFPSLAVVLGGFIVPLQAQDEPSDPGGVLDDLSLEQLMDVEVEIVSKTKESLARVPAAVTVLDGDDIRRSGAQTIPDILRQAVGVNVAQQNANYYAVSIRGFNDVFANKLLVLMDGRSVYSPLFSGTFWDVQDTVLDDIERIEIVRGPGATVWGANAVNGVINIISKSAKDTQGSLVKVGFGSTLQGVAAMRHGMKLSDDLYLRLYGKFANFDNLPQPNTGISANDAYYTGRGGFRADYLPEDGTEITVQGEIYGGKVANTYSLPPAGFSLTPGTLAPGLSGVGGGHLLGRLEKELADDRKLTLQAYYDRTVRQTVVFDESRDTGDLEAQYDLSLGRHQVAIGAGYRVSADDIGMLNVSFTPQERVTHLFSTFVQDDIELNDRTRASLGTKLEHNQFTGFEVQPSFRLSHVLNDREMFWLSVARAVRTPSRVEDDVMLGVTVPFGPGFVPSTINGTRLVESEDMLAYEFGYRAAALKNVTIELSVFYNQYSDLRTIEFNGATFGGGNRAEGEAYGVEIAPVITLTDWWQLRPSYALLQMDLRAAQPSNDALTLREEDQSPEHTVTMNSRMTFRNNLDLDVTARYVDQIFVSRANVGAGQSIPSYWAIDARVGWRPQEGLELAVVGQSLLDNKHQEFAPTFVSTRAAEVQHSIFGTLTYRF
ncbi:MAG: TonB-dependent receptor plug domain-containing protein [Limisphaerales bacterium]